MLKDLSVGSKRIVLLTVVIALGIILRVINISNNPPSLYGDELTMVYDSYSLLKTSHDQTGEFLPITFKMGAGRLPGYVYGSIPFVAIFGPTALAVRSLSILSGIGIIILLYILGKKLFSSEIGLLAAALVSVSPWDISLSRGGFESHLALFLTLLAVTIFLMRGTKKWYLIISTLSFGLASQTYPTYKLTIPLLMIILVLSTHLFKNVNKKIIVSYIPTLVILLFIGGLAIFQAVNTSSESRLKEINIFSQVDLQSKIIQKIDYERTISDLPLKLSDFFHNRPLEYTNLLLEGYTNNFSFSFLFVHGDGNPRHNMATMGEFYPIELITIILGIVYFAKSKKRELKFLIFWLLISPLGAVLFLDPHALRDSLMIPPLVLLSAGGFLYITKLLLKYKPSLLLIFLVIFAAEITIFLERIYFVAPVANAEFWSYPAKAVSLMAINQSSKFDYILISDRIDSAQFAYPVYAVLDPQEVISQNQSQSDLSGYSVRKYKNIYIGYFPDSQEEKIISSLPGSVLYIGTIYEKMYLKDPLPIYDPDGSVVALYQIKR